MKTKHTTRRAAVTAARPQTSQRGVALVITLLLLMMMMALAVAMVLAAGSDLLIGGYYRNHRGAFYSADSGLSIVRQQVANQLAAQAPATFPPGTPPLPANAAATVQAAILGQYGAYTNLNSGQATNSWPGNFRINNFQLALAAGMPVVTSCDPLGGPVVNPACPGGGQPSGYQYIYNYEVHALGRSTATEESEVQENGSIIMNAALSPAAPMSVSFASWGFFLDNWQICTGTLVPGTLSGPVHTNGAWTFGTSGNYIFTDPLTQVDQDFGFRFTSSRCEQDPTPPESHGGQTINPTFQAGYTTGAAAVPLPQNDFSQKRAVLDGFGTNATNPTGAEMSNVLKRADGTAYPPSGANGVYMPYSTATPPPAGCTSVPCMTGGGIYVQGNASVVLSTVGASGQRYQITQSGTTTTITIDSLTNQTTMQVGSGPVTTIEGVPTDNNTGNPATMLYVQGDVTGMRGPAQGVPAIQDGSAMTVTASGNVTVTGDLLYKTPPVTKTANDPCCPGTPPGTPIPGNDNGQVLGIFTATGDVILDRPSSSLNLEIDASIATISNGGSGGIRNIGTSSSDRIDVLNIVGGRIQNNIKNINSITRNVFYDRRFAAGFAPPWFPSTSITPPGVATATFNSNTQRQRWFNTSAQ